MPRHALFALLVAALVTLLWWASGRSGALGDGADRGPLRSAERASSDVQLEGGERVDRGQDRVAPVTPEPPNPAATEEPAGVETGTLTLWAEDGQTGGTLDLLSLQRVDGQRWLALDRPSPLTVELDPGEHELVLHRPRYDPISLGKSSIVAGEESDLGRIRMYAGSASLAGTVRVPRVIATGDVVLELHGSGRNPCVVCPPPEQEATCRTCGFALEQSTRTLPIGAKFRFDRLAAGEYHLVVYDQDGAVLVTQKLLLEVSEHRWLELDLQFVDLKLRVTGADGLPFEGIWEEEGELFSGRMRFFLMKAGVCCGASAWTPDTPVRPTEALFEPPEGLEERVASSRRIAGPSILTPPPLVRTRPLPLERIAPDRFELGRVPVSSTSLIVTCGPYFTATPLELELWDGTPIELALDRRCNMPSQGLEGMTSCTSCHGLPLGVLR